MDPYLEQHWEDVHAALISYTRDAIQSQLSDELVARIETVYVEDDSETQLRRSDVHVAAHPPVWMSHPGEASTATLDLPVMLQPIGDPIRQRSVVIYDSGGKRIVTAIEILSPWNKASGKPVSEYLKKREKYVNSEMNLVEIDLIRTGDWTRMIGRYHIPDQLRKTYRVTVDQPENAAPYLYAIAMDARLPNIRIPLRPQDEEAKLNLQELLDKAYQMGRYDRIDYSKPCYPPPTPAEEQWIEQTLKAASKR